MIMAPFVTVQGGTKLVRFSLILAPILAKSKSHEVILCPETLIVSLPPKRLPPFRFQQNPNNLATPKKRFMILAPGLAGGIAGGKASGNK
jgi:hypothetical protein